MRPAVLPAAALVCLAAAQGQAPPPDPLANDPHAADREQLLKIFHEVESSINSQGLARMASQLDPQAVVVWANGEVSRGPQEVLDYYARMVGKGKILTKYMTRAKLSGHARFLGDGNVAIADGTMDDEYYPILRGPFRLDNRWSMTAAKIDGEWKVVALHLSGNVFNNVLIDEAKSAIFWAGGLGVAAGLLLGVLAGRRLARRRAGQAG